MNVSLIIPGLLDKGIFSCLETPALPSLTCLTRLLSRSHNTALEVSGFHELLFDLFGIRGESRPGIPVAPVTWLADAGSPADSRDDGFWLRADPVHLRADQSRLVLFDASVLSISSDEASRLAATVNEFYSAQGWRLEPVHPDRWYLKAGEAIRIQTSPVYAVGGHDIDTYLPKGEDSRIWHGVMNEIQMLLHDHPVNQARSEAGKPVINSIWFWGEGVCPQPAAVDWTRIVSAEPVSRGLAALAGVPWTEPAATADENLASQSDSANEMIVLDNLVTSSVYGDTEAWRKTVVALERDWFAPLTSALKRGLLKQLTVYPCDGQRFRVTRAGLRRFWRAAKPLETFVAHG